MDLSRHLVLYSGGVDSTFLIEREESARHLIHYQSLNIEQTKAAQINAIALNRFLTVKPMGPGKISDGEINQIHAIYDAQMALDASIVALHFGLQGIVMGFNADDLGIHEEAIEAVVRRVSPKFEILMPLRKMKAAEIRATSRASKLRAVSCMRGIDCGHCPKCVRGY